MNEDKKKALEALDKVGLKDQAHKKPNQMSGGQQQRVAFVRLLAQPADFIMLDEPVSHLDQANAAIMGAMLKQRQKEEGPAVIITSIGNRLPYEYDKILKL